MTEQYSELTQEQLDELRELIAGNRSVRAELPEGGRLHVDRQLPFLCLYRMQASDDVSLRLVLGESVYLIQPPQMQSMAEYKTLLHTIAHLQYQAFGAFLIIELWADEKGFEDISDNRPAFQIVAPKHHVPADMLEAMESYLLDIEVAEQHAQVLLNYCDGRYPRDNPLYPDTDELDQLSIMLLGLKVRPVYRDEESGQIFPFELKQLHHGLTHALKKVFYYFSHNHTSDAPEHYQSLGPRAITPAVQKTDEQLAEISSNFDLLLHVSPVNAPAAWRQFKESNFKKTPQFLYRPRPIDPDLVKRQLYQIPIEQIDDPTLAYIFSSKREELDRQLNLIADRNTPRFLLSSRALYGDVEDELLLLAREMLGRPERTQAVQSPALSPQQFAQRAEEEIAYYRQQNPALNSRVELRDDVPGIMVSKGNFLVGRDSAVAQNRVEATLAHEIGTHVVTHFNGKQQPFRELYAGMAGYEPMQEGLAVISEYLVGQLSTARMRLLAGRVVAAKLIIDGADFIECFNTLHKDYGFNDYTAYTISMRIYRGGGYIKDVVYLRGVLRILAYLAAGGALEPLYLGKLSHEHLHHIEELQWRRVVNPPALLPRYFSQPEAMARLEKLRQGMTVFDLLEAE